MRNTLLLAQKTQLSTINSNLIFISFWSLQQAYQILQLACSIPIYSVIPAALSVQSIVQWPVKATLCRKISQNTRREGHEQKLEHNSGHLFLAKGLAEL